MEYLRETRTILLLLLQALAVVLSWLLNPAAPGSTLSLSLLLSACFLTFATIIHVYRVEKGGESASAAVVFGSSLVALVLLTVAASFSFSYALQIGLFLVLPYLAIAIFAGGLLVKAARWLAPKEATGLYAVSIVPYTFTRSAVVKDVMKRIFGFYTLPKMEDDRMLIVGTVAFHYGIWSWIISHLVLVFGMNTLDPAIYDFVGSYVARPAAFLAIGGLVILTVRRAGLRKIRSISFLDDYVPLALLLIILGPGLVQTLYVGVGDMDMVALWLLSVFTLRPDITPMASVSPLTVIYVVLSLAFLAYVPLSKMVHIVTYIFIPTVTKSSYPVDARGLEFVMRKNHVAASQGTGET